MSRVQVEVSGVSTERELTGTRRRRVMLSVSFASRSAGAGIPNHARVRSGVAEDGPARPPRRIASNHDADRDHARIQHGTAELQEQEPIALHIIAEQHK